MLRPTVDGCGTHSQKSRDLALRHVLFGKRELCDCSLPIVIVATERAEPGKSFRESCVRELLGVFVGLRSPNPLCRLPRSCDVVACEQIRHSTQLFGQLDKRAPNVSKYQFIDLEKWSFIVLLVGLPGVLAMRPRVAVTDDLCTRSRTRTCY